MSEASKEDGDITQEEEDYTLSVISRHELSGTSELFPGTTLKRNGEVTAGTWVQGITSVLQS
jgi:hypothetical protein